MSLGKINFDIIWYSVIFAATFIFVNIRLIIWFLELRFYECCHSCLTFILLNEYLVQTSPSAGLDNTSKTKLTLKSKHYFVSCHDKVKVRKEYEWSVNWGYEKKTKFDILDLLFYLLCENCRYGLFDKTHKITTFHALYNYRQYSFLKLW